VSTAERTSVRQIGRSAPRRDAKEKLRGEAQFAGDIVLPRMLHGKVLRSPVPHARIVSIDTRAAEAMPGVVCVLTHRDLDDIDQFWGHAIRDRPVIAVGKVRFHGEPVAAVAAESEAEAAAAVEAIEVVYEDLPVVADVLQAVAPGA
jgi:CO/xanthine dehydrogenase Mo-binding subunit